MTDGDPIIRYEGVCKRFGDKVVLKDLDLEVHRGETLAIMGPSGIGKSVTLRHAVGLLQPDSGRSNWIPRAPTPIWHWGRPIASTPIWSPTPIPREWRRARRRAV